MLEVLEHTKADSAAFVKELDEFRARMLQQARQDRVQSFVAALRDSAKVVDDRAQAAISSSREARAAAGSDAAAVVNGGPAP